ncbi:MAG: ABC transporter substrate-binding protein [Anaerolineae bacterium]|jgi:peptide/nickel transport system substrate-binding protein|nr:ABC transporter substrate-binding protein [Anaerolineae bacterium]
MNKKFLFILASVLIILSLVLGACQPKEEEPMAEEEAVVEEPAEEEMAEGEGEAEIDAAAIAASLPRDETIYYAGLQWGSVIGSNPYSDNNNLAFMGGQRNLMHETPYMYNMIDGSFTPLLADGDYAWNADLTEITFKIKEAAHWQDGTPVTAEDVAYTWATHVKYETSTGVGNQDYIADVVAMDDLTVVVKAALTDEGKAVNPLLVVNYLSQTPVVQKAWTQTLEDRAGGDAAALKADPGFDAVLSGPYKMLFNDDTKVVLIRDDNYWGQDASMWGMLPVPKYVAHTIYADNNAGFVALKEGEVDISQQFNANVQLLWLEDNLPISTYMEEAPYGLTASLPTAYFNLKSFGLDNVAVRKAIAMAVDYDTIIANAMTNQSPTFAEVPRSVMNPTAGEQALYDHDAVADLQWAGNDVAGANALLDEAGIVDTDGDGYREIDGQNLSYNAVCPNGWSDWQAAIEIVAAAGEDIGIEITTLFPEWGVYQTVFTEGTQTEYDIFMVWSDGAGPTQPWGRVRQLMSPDFAGTSGNWNGNWGGYVNPRIGEIIAAIPQTTDRDELVDLYTEATEIYLTDVPSFTLMYRPDQFYTVNESVWTGFPSADDGLNIPPLNLADGYGIAALYHLELVNP